MFTGKRTNIISSEGFIIAESMLNPYRLFPKKDLRKPSFNMKLAGWGSQD